MRKSKSRRSGLLCVLPDQLQRENVRASHCVQRHRLCWASRGPVCLVWTASVFLTNLQILLNNSVPRCPEPEHASVRCCSRSHTYTRLATSLYHSLITATWLIFRSIFLKSELVVHKHPLSQCYERMVSIWRRQISHNARIMFNACDHSYNTMS